MSSIVRVINCLDGLRGMSTVPWASELVSPIWELGETINWPKYSTPDGWDTLEDLRHIEDSQVLVCDAPEIEPGAYMVTGRMSLTRAWLSNKAVMACIDVTDSGMRPGPWQDSYAVTGDYARGLPNWAGWKLLGALDAVRESGVPFKEHGLVPGKHILCLRRDNSPICLGTI